MNANALSASAVGAEPVGTLGRDGYRILDSWAAVASAKQWAEAVTGMFETTHTEVARNLHLSQPWAEELVRSPDLLDAVEVLIGPDIAIENTFLVVKWPGSNFEVPLHQDGINDRLRLDPLQSVAAWLALTDTRADSGCVEVVPGSHLRGYLDYGPEQDQGAARSEHESTANSSASPSKSTPEPDFSWIRDFSIPPSRIANRPFESD